jgi:hypothetical protein
MVKSSIRYTSFICFFLFAAGYAFGQHVIHLKDTTLLVKDNAGSWLSKKSQLRSATPLQVLIQFNTLPGKEGKNKLLHSGIDIGTYIDDNTFLAIVHPSAKLSDANTQQIDAIVDVLPSWKLSAYLKRVKDTRQDNVEVLVSFLQDVGAEDALAEIKQAGGQLLAGNLQQYNLYAVSIPSNKLLQLANYYGVSYINPLTRNEPLDKESKAGEKVTIANAPVSVGGYGLLGDGVTIGVGDNVSGIFHIDLKDRIINYNPAKLTHHGVHINGITGGAGIVNDQAEGMAPHATLVNHLFDNILANTGICLQDHHMTITNNSYAVVIGDTGYSGIYDNYAVLVDRLERQYDKVQHVFAAGNDGYINRPPYPQGFATITGGYQPAKNNIVVTSTTKWYVNADDGSRGPVNDGRLKPDITANGVNVLSSIDLTGYLVSGGTSMASPQVAGALGLLSQRYKQLHANTDPRSDVLKAIILNGTDDIGNPGPDYRFGFGYLDLYRSLQILDSNRYTTNTIAQGGQQSLNITVPPNTAQLKVMLCWHDAPASPLSAKQLINDLDLTVQDPSNIVHKPLILDPTPANILNNAAEGEDHLNNVEQVTINNPAQGTYIAKVFGYSQPAGNQDYVVAYDFVPTGTQLMYPISHSTAAANDSMRIYWNASEGNDPFTLQYSTDNGNNWTIIDNNIPADQRYYTWAVPNISSGKCKVQLSRNNTAEVSVSGTFAISPLPQLRLDSIQCPGYISVNWDAIPNATAYEVMRKIGPVMAPIDSVTSTNYTLSGLATDSTYYVAIRPIIDGLGGSRSLAVFRMPDSGTCAGSYTDGDLMLEAITSPGSGRKFTNSELGNSVSLSVRVRNLDDMPCAAYQFHYRWDAGPWQTYIGQFALPANADTVISIPASLDLSAIGAHTLQVAVENMSLTDPVAQNDTASRVVVQLKNDPIDLSGTYTDGFEAMPEFSILHDSMGISPDEHWDYTNTSPDTARIRSYVNDSITISGNRSLSMDVNLNMPGAQNYLLGTFNLSNYDTATTEIRVDYDYRIAGRPKFNTGNQVWARAADDDNLPWVLVKDYDATLLPGQVYSSGTISLNDAMRTCVQNFGTALQLRFGQRDSGLIAMKGYGNGMTIDNFRIYTIQHDVQLLSVVSPETVGCGLGNTVPLSVKIYNSVNTIQNNVGIYYSLDNGPTISDTIPSIAGKDTMIYTFPQPMQLASQGSHTLNIWVAAAGDGYPANDTIANYVFHNEPLITSYPYLEDFESGDGYWYAEGINSSWEYGTPASPKIHKAASGSKAWKTNLDGPYNNLETSFLYSPCFDISSLSKPMLSFSMAMDIENCGGTLCDAAIVEYSFDGVSWSLLGLNGEGTNWYNEPNFQLWNLENDTRWHVASIPLPAGPHTIRLRFSFYSDPGANREGMAVDDIHIFDNVHHIYEGSDTGPVNQNISGNQWADITQSEDVLTSIQPNAQNLGNTGVSMFTHGIFSNPFEEQYLFPRSYVVSATEQPANNTGLRLYITDSEFLSVLNDTSCATCSKPEDAYSLGITKYDGTNENGSIADNEGTYTYYPANTIKWVPYDKGYYAEVNVSPFSEFWFNDGGPTGAFDLGTEYLSFTANKITHDNVKLEWISHIDTSIATYELQRSYNDSTFSAIYNTVALHQPSPVYDYIDTPTVADGGSVFYKLMWTMTDGRIFYSPVRRVDWLSDKEAIVYPNPVHDGNIYINWAADAGTQMQVVITNEIGKQVYKKSFTATSYNTITHISLGRPGSGIYFVKVIIGDTRHVYKIVCW